MAYYQQDDDDQLNPEAAGGIATSGQSSVISGDSGAAGDPQAKAPGTPDKSGNFVGIKQYLDANKPQAAKLGDQASGVIDQSANQARGAVQGLKQTFDQKAQAPSPLDPEALANIGQAEKLTSEQRAGLGGALKGSYQGPNDLMDSQVADQYTAANKSLEKARGNVAGSGTEEGRVNIISQINNKPRTAGISQFDNTLLSAGGGREKLAQAADRNKDVQEDVLGSANAEAKAKADAAKAQVAANKTQVSTALDQAKGGFQKSVDQKLQDAIAKALQGNIAVTQDLADLNLERENLDMFGLNEGDQIWGLDLNNYLQQADPTSLNVSNVSSAEDYARAQALAEIAGTPFDGFTDPSMAGTAQTGPKVNLPALQKDRGEKSAKFDADYKKAYNEAEIPAWSTHVLPGLKVNIPALTPAKIQEVLDNPGLLVQQYGVPLEVVRSNETGHVDDKYGILAALQKNLSSFTDNFRDEHGANSVVNKRSKASDAPRTAPGGGTVYYKGGK